MAKPNASSAPLPAERIQADRFGKARLARANALREDYVELIADLLATEGEPRPTDIARRLGVSHVSVVKAIAAEVDAEGIRHHVSNATLKAFGRYLRIRESSPSPTG